MGNPEPIKLIRHYRQVLVATANHARRSALAMVTKRQASSGDDWLGGTFGTGWRTAAIEAARLPSFAKWFTNSGA